ncbi:hypothetical protein [Neobacillus sp. D3-1R]|uniref:hypothetical protein n=1 Tax=Neobacillus sp. D3-1R TaxID=3445778 RepID=UPI003FA10C24
MLLKNSDLVKLFPKSQGIKDDLQFKTVSTDASLIQPKGLFIPVFDDSGELKEAIHNGAIAAIWEEQQTLPSYVPNQFPIFFTKDIKNAFETIVAFYLEQFTGDNNDLMNMTKFLFIEEKLLNESFSSYDKPVFKFVSKQERRG